MSKTHNTIYNSRKWLNENDCSFTGSVVCHMSTFTDDDGKEKVNAFVELGGCHSKTRIHHDYDNSSLDDYKEKIHKLKQEIDNYYNFLLSL